MTGHRSSNLVLKPFLSESEPALSNGLLIATNDLPPMEACWRRKSPQKVSPATGLSSPVLDVACADLFHLHASGASSAKWGWWYLLQGAFFNRWKVIAYIRHLGEFLYIVDGYKFYIFSYKVYVMHICAYLTSWGITLGVLIKTSACYSTIPACKEQGHSPFIHFPAVSFF